MTIWNRSGTTKRDIFTKQNHFGYLKRKLTILATVGLSASTLAACSSASAASSSTVASSSSQGSSLKSLLPASIQKSGVLTIGMDPTFPPYEFYGPGNKLTGYEPELLDAMVNKLGVKLNLVSTSFDELIPGVAAGRFNAAMSGISDTKTREAQVTFVDYGRYATSLVYSKSNPGHVTNNPLSICGGSVSTQKGTISVTDAILLAQNCVSHGKPTVTAVQFPDSASTFLAAKSGRVDAQIQDYIESVYEVQQVKGAVSMTSPYSLFPHGDLGIITKIGSKQLDNALLKALKAIMADGTYAKVISKWNIPSVTLSTPGINLGAK